MITPLYVGIKHQWLIYFITDLFAILESSSLPSFYSHFYSETLDRPVIVRIPHACFPRQCAESFREGSTYPASTTIWKGLYFNCFYSLSQS